MIDLFNVAGRTALVTGSSRGLGRSLATALAQAGAQVTIHGRDVTVLNDVRGEIEAETGADLDIISFDVTDAAEAERGIADLIATNGIPDILVNNAGLQRRAPFTEFPVTDWDAVVAGNLSSVFYVSRFLTPGMCERGSGKVINIGSVQSRLARETIAPYAASKAGVAMLTQGMAADLARYNVQVNAISPGYFATEMNRALVDDETFDSWVRTRTPAQRWGEAPELWGTLLYLASDASAFVSGQNIFVDGGMTAVV